VEAKRRDRQFVWQAEGEEWSLGALNILEVNGYFNAKNTDIFGSFVKAQVMPPADRSPRESEKAMMARSVDICSFGMAYCLTKRLPKS
jgi:hypothetical protein